MIGRKKIFKYLTIIIGLLLIISCSNKKSPFGYNQGFEIKIDTLTNIVDIKKSYSDTIYNYPEDPVLSIGNFHEIETKSLFRFLTLPDTTWLDSVTINSCKISLTRRGTNSENDDTQFNLTKIKKSWLENTVTWDSLNGYWGEAIDTDFSYVEDTLYFDLPDTLLKYWIENDTINYGFGMEMESTNTDSIFTEFYSSEEGYSPELIILSTGDSGIDDTLTFYPSKDATIAKNNSPDTEYNSGFIANLPPFRTIFEIDIDSLKNHLIKNDSINPTDIEKISINRADIILDSLLIQESYLTNDMMTLYPHYINDTTNYDDFGYIPGTDNSYYTGSDSLALNISGILQAQLRDLLDTDQFFVKSKYENKDYSYIKFTQEFEGIKPTLKIIFTLSNQE